MKVLLISPFFAPFIGVAALRMTSLAAFLRDKGIEITVIRIADDCLEHGMTTGERLSGISYVEFTPPSGFSDMPQMYSIIDELCKENSFDCCVVSCGPYYTVKPAMYLQERYGVPLVVDYRDLWLYDPRPTTTLRSFLIRHRNRLLYYATEEKLMRACSAFVSVTPRSVSSMIQHYPILKKKALCIYNGYQAVDLDPTSIPELPDGIRLCVLGKLSYYTQNGATTFFQASHRLLEKGYPIQIVHIGKKEESIPALLKQAQIPNANYCELGQMPYEKALAVAQTADICVAIINYAEGLGTKLFDYIYLNRPIVAYAPQNSEFEELLADAENAFVCQTSDQMADAIEKIVTEHISNLTVDGSFGSRFSRDRQNERYLQLLNSLQEDHQCSDF